MSWVVRGGGVQGGRRARHITSSTTTSGAGPTSIVLAPKKSGEDQAIGRSRGGLTTKIHALVDALGNPVGFFLTGGEAHDLVGADHRPPTMEADTLIADKAFDADGRVSLSHWQPPARPR